MKRSLADKSPLLNDHQFDWVYTLLSLWFVAGVFLDGWAHNHVPDLETFFTPWHAALYSGFFALTALLAARVLMNHLRGEHWRKAVPRGYAIAIFGALLFLVSGFGDMIWHTLFGVEESIEALLSPTHLGLAIGGTMMVHAPFHAGWMRAKTNPAALKHRLPMILSLTFTISIISFITQFAHPVRITAGGLPPLDPEYAELLQEVDIAGIYFQTMFLMGVLLYAMRRIRFPIGSFFLIFTLNTFAMSFMTDRYLLVLAAALAGILTDLWYHLLKPSAEHPLGLHLWSFFTPAMLYLAFFLTIDVTEGIWWSVHLWTGAIVMPGIIGLMMSHLIVPHSHWLTDRVPAKIQAE